MPASGRQRHRRDGQKARDHNPPYMPTCARTPHTKRTHDETRREREEPGLSSRRYILGMRGHRPPTLISQPAEPQAARFHGKAYTPQQDAINRSNPTLPNDVGLTELQQSRPGCCARADGAARARGQTVGTPECASGRRPSWRHDSASASKSESITADAREVWLLLRTNRSSAPQWSGRGRVGGRRRAARSSRLASVSSRRRHRTVHAIFPHTAPRRSSPVGIQRPDRPRPVGSWRDDGSVEVDQPQAVRRLVGDDLHAVPPAAFVALADEPREAVHRVVVDLVEGAIGVSVLEIARPAAQEPVEVPARSPRRVPAACAGQ
jgi:hypothetical protein